MRYVIVSLMLLTSLFGVSATAQETTTAPPVEPIITESTVTTNGRTTTTLKSPPASAISPTINTSNSDLCTFGVAGAVQTQILGISTGTQVTDENCERLKNAKTLYDMGMKVAAVSVMCQDIRVFEAMMHAGTPCPYDGLIGLEAKAAWQVNEEERPDFKDENEGMNNNEKKTLFGVGGVLALLLSLLAL